MQDERTPAAGRRCGDVVGVRGRRAAEHLGEDRGAPRLGRLPRLEDEHGRALGDHEAVAAGGEGLRHARDDSAVMFVKPAMLTGVMAASRAAGDHGVAATAGDPHRGVDEGVGARRAGGAHRLARALPAPAHRHRGAGRVRHHHRHQERRHPARALLDVADDLLLERADAADAGGDQHATAQRVAADVTGLLEGLRGGRRARAASRGRPGGPPSGCRTPTAGSKSRTRRSPSGGGAHRPSQKASTPVPHDDEDADAGDRDPSADHVRSCTLAPRLAVTMSRAWPTVLMSASSSSSTVMSNSSSSAITSSARSRLSASRSSAKLASRRDLGGVDGEDLHGEGR